MGIDITINAYLLDFGGVDVILWVAWLETLGRCLVNWKEKFMAFNHRNQYYVMNFATLVVNLVSL